MITLSRASEYAKNVHRVQLESHEVNMTDAQLINVADGSKPEGPSYHFGGHVTRDLVDGVPHATITVYID